jgi:hypothetical protein
MLSIAAQPSSVRKRAGVQLEQLERRRLHGGQAGRWRKFLRRHHRRIQPRSVRILFMANCCRSIKSQCVLGNAGFMSDEDLVTECASLDSTAIPRNSGMTGGRCELTDLRNASMCTGACFAPTGPKRVANNQCINRNMAKIDCVRYNESAMPIQFW